ncbi:GDP-L-fucose synthase [Polynucleobacter paneuropaeus]|nr:GDP-L-fucose synthase [Polynucleobacter paneuropaeus]
MVGSAIVRGLRGSGQCNIVTRSRSELDLTNQMAVRDFLRSEKPDQIYLVAAKVGGIHANNTYPAEFIYENLMVQSIVIHEAFCAGVKKLLFLGSSCIYPKLAPQPISEDALLTGALEPTNEPYAIAKIAGIKMCDSYNRQYGHSHGIDYRSIMPTNLYGPGDNFHPTNSHVIPGLIRKIHDAKAAKADHVVIWGTGTPRREFLFVDDMAAASIFSMNIDKLSFLASTSQDSGHLNVGYGKDISIRELAAIIAEVVGFKGRIEFDQSKLDGPPQKLIDSSKINQLGWHAQTELRDGLTLAYKFFENEDAISA